MDKLRLDVEFGAGTPAPNEDDREECRRVDKIRSDIVGLDQSLDRIKDQQALEPQIDGPDVATSTTFGQVLCHPSVRPSRRLVKQDGS